MAAVEEQQQSVLWGWWQSVLQSIAVDNECQCTRLHQLLPSGRRLWKDQAEFASVQLNNNKKKIMKVLYSTKIKQMAACQPGTNIYWRKATRLGVCVCSSVMWECLIWILDRRSLWQHVLWLIIIPAWVWRPSAIGRDPSPPLRSRS